MMHLVIRQQDLKKILNKVEHILVGREGRERISLSPEMRYSKKKEIQLNIILIITN